MESNDPSLRKTAKKTSSRSPHTPRVACPAPADAVHDPGQPAASGICGGERWRGERCERSIPGKRGLLPPRPHPLPAEPRLRTGDIPGRAKLGGPWGGDHHDQLLPAAQRGYPGELLPNLVSFQVVAVGT